MSDNGEQGRFVWHELMTPDPEGARNFYTQTIGWHIERAGNDSGYAMFATPGGPLGGAGEQPSGGASLWIPFVGVTDVDDALRRALDLGATATVLPTLLDEGGRYAVLADPQGATIGIYSGAGLEPERDADLGEFSWHELAATNHRAAFDFYRELFGWKMLAEHDMGPMGVYAIFGRNGAQLGGMFDKQGAGRPGPAYWVSYVRVDDVKRAIENVEAARGAVLAGPMEVPGGDLIAQVSDPYGALLALHQVVAKTEAKGSAEPRSSARANTPSRDAGAEPADDSVADIWTSEPAGRKTAKGAARKAAKKKTSKKKKTAKKKKKAKAARGRTAGKAAKASSGKKAAKKTRAKKTAKRSAKKTRGGKAAKTGPAAPQKGPGKKKTAKKKAAKKKTAKKKASKKKPSKKKASKKKASKKKVSRKQTGKKKAAKKKSGTAAMKRAGRSRPAKKTAGRTTKKPGRKPSKKSGQKTGKKTGKRTSKKAGRKTGPKTARKSGGRARAR